MKKLMMIVFAVVVTSYSCDMLCMDKLRHIEQTLDRIAALLEKQEITEDISKICYALLGKRDVSIDGSQINSLDELVTAIKDKSIDDINRMLDDSAFIGWLNRMGFEKETKKIQEMGR